MRYAFAGDREISCRILKFIIDKGYKPSALLLSDRRGSTHSKELIKLANIEEEFIFWGSSFLEQKNIQKLIGLSLDYAIGIHFPFVIPERVLKIPRLGFVNLHPAYLPYNKGWHTPSWAILDKTPFGATLHFMTKELDKGDIIHQKKLEISPDDTAHSLYQKVLQTEEEVFYEAFEELENLNPQRTPQLTEGTSHNRRELKEVQQLNLQEISDCRSFLDKLRALTTNNLSELAFFELNGKRIGVQVKFIELD